MIGRGKRIEMRDIESMWLPVSMLRQQDCFQAPVHEFACADKSDQLNGIAYECEKTCTRRLDHMNQELGVLCTPVLHA